MPYNQTSGEGDYDRAWHKVVELVVAHGGRPVKIGRCALRDFKDLAGRDEYKSAASISRIWTGPRAPAAEIERRLTLWFIANMPSICLNRQVGGGPQSSDPDHCVYMALW